MWELDHKEDWARRIDAFKLWCWRSLESPLDCKEIQPVNPKGNQPWMFIGRTDAEAPILWTHDVKNRLFGKDPDAGKDWGQQEKGATEDGMVGWHHRLNGHESEQTPGDSRRQKRLVWCSPWSHKESDTTERMNNNRATVNKLSQTHQNNRPPKQLPNPVNLHTQQFRESPKSLISKKGNMRLCGIFQIWSLETSANCAKKPGGSSLSLAFLICAQKTVTWRDPLHKHGLDQDISRRYSHPRTLSKWKSYKYHTSGLNQGWFSCSHRQENPDTEALNSPEASKIPESGMSERLSGRFSDHCKRLTLQQERKPGLDTWESVSRVSFNLNLNCFQAPWETGAID